MMTRRNKKSSAGFPPELFASGSGKAGSFVPVFSSLLLSEAYKSLTHRQARLLIVALLEFNRQAALSPSDTRRPSEEFGLNTFYLNKGLYQSYGLYMTHTEDFTADMKILSERGFLELVSSGFSTRERNVYRALRKWETWTP